MTSGPAAVDAGGPPGGGGRRLVSLVPSVTEILSTWGVDPVACTRFCERPDLVHVGGTKNPDVDRIVEIAPDAVVVDRQENRHEDAVAIAAAGIDVVDLDVRSVDDLDAELERLAVAAGITAPPLHRPSPMPLGLEVFVPIWRRPWMTIAGPTFGSALLAALGLENVFARSPNPYPEVSLAEAQQAQPDLVLVPSEPYSFTDEHCAELRSIAPVLRVDGRDLFWWGTRTPAAMMRLWHGVAAAVRTAGEVGRDRCGDQ